MDHIIQKIKREGIETAETKSKGILDDANKQAAAVIDDAKKEAESIVNEARHEAMKLEASAKQAVRQTYRDVILMLRSRLTDILDSIVKKETAAALTTETLQNIILKVVDEWKTGSSMNIDLVLNGQEKKNLESFFSAKLADELKKGMEIKTSKAVAKGVRIQQKDGKAYYDITDEMLGDMLLSALTPKYAEIVSPEEQESMS